MDKQKLIRLIDRTTDSSAEWDGTIVECSGTHRQGPSDTLMYEFIDVRGNLRCLAENEVEELTRAEQIRAERNGVEPFKW